LIKNYGYLIVLRSLLSYLTGEADAKNGNNILLIYKDTDLNYAIHRLFAAGGFKVNKCQVWQRCLDATTKQRLSLIIAISTWVRKALKDCRWMLSVIK